jgi:hypothetical protein
VERGEADSGSGVAFLVLGEDVEVEEGESGFVCIRDFGLVADGDSNVFAYRRMFGTLVALVICNFTDGELAFGVLEG